MISEPCFVVMVTLLIRSFVFGRSVAVSGRAGAVSCAGVRCCFAWLPSRMSSGTVLFVGDGSAGLLWQLVGAVAIGELAGGSAVDALAGALVSACGGSCVALRFAGSVSVVSAVVCVSVVIVDLRGGWKINGCE